MQYYHHLARLHSCLQANTGVCRSEGKMVTSSPLCSSWYERQTMLDRVKIPFYFSCGIYILNRNHVFIDKLGITEDELILFILDISQSVSKGHQPCEALANFRWLRSIPEEFRDWTWIEELLMTWGFVCDRIVRLGQRNNPFSVFSIEKTWHLSLWRDHSPHRCSTALLTESLTAEQLMEAE